MPAVLAECWELDVLHACRIVLLPVPSLALFGEVVRRLAPLADKQLPCTVGRVCSLDTGPAMILPIKMLSLCSKVSDRAETKIGEKSLYHVCENLGYLKKGVHCREIFTSPCKSNAVESAAAFQVLLDDLV